MGKRFSLWISLFFVLCCSLICSFLFLLVITAQGTKRWMYFETNGWVEKSAGISNWRRHGCQWVLAQAIRANPQGWGKLLTWIKTSSFLGFTRRVYPQHLTFNMQYQRRNYFYFRISKDRSLAESSKMTLDSSSTGEVTLEQADKAPGRWSWRFQ